jgi:hypothetical protein
LMLAIGEAAASQQTAVALILDEIQYLAESDLAPLIMAIHRVTARQLPLVLFGAGLPQVRGKMGDAKSYVERLLDFPGVDALSAADARRAIAEPAWQEGVEFEDDALNEIVRVTSGYPYFLHEWGHAVWRQAKTTPITKEVVFASHAAVISQLYARDGRAGSWIAPLRRHRPQIWRCGYEPRRSVAPSSQKV